MQLDKCITIWYTYVHTMNKKQDPKTKFIIVRVTPMEKQWLIESADETETGFSDFIRSKILNK